jgi:hypothetical protein
MDGRDRAPSLVEMGWACLWHIARKWWLVGCRSVAQEERDGPDKRGMAQVPEEEWLGNKSKNRLNRMCLWGEGRDYG